MSDPLIPPTPIEDPIFKPIELFQEKELLDGTEFIAVSENEKVNLKDQILKAVVNNNITETKPLPENEYYTLTTAVAAVEENLRKVGYELSFVRKVVNEYYYETYKFKGLIEEFTDLTKWDLEHNYLFDNITTKMPELYFSNDGVSLSESISEGDITVPVNVGQTQLQVPFEYKVKDYLYIEKYTLIRTQSIIQSTNSPWSQYLWLQVNGGNKEIGSYDHYGVLYVKDKLRVKTYFITKPLFLKPGDSLILTLSCSRQSGTQSDSYIIKNTEPVLAMVVFIPPSFVYNYINSDQGFALAADTQGLFNSKRPNIGNISDETGVVLDNYIKWSGTPSTLKFIFINKVIYSDISIPYNLPHKVFIENKKVTPLVLDFKMDNVDEKLMSTFGDEYTLQPGYAIIITYQWVVWEDGTVICMLTKTDDFVIQ